MDDGVGENLEGVLRQAEAGVVARGPVPISEYAERWGSLNKEMGVERMTIKPELMDDEVLETRVLRKKAEGGSQPIMWGSFDSYRATFLLEERQEMVRQAGASGVDVSEDEALRKYAELTGMKFADEEGAE